MFEDLERIYKFMYVVCISFRRSSDPVGYRQVIGIHFLRSADHIEWVPVYLDSKFRATSRLSFSFSSFVAIND